MSERTEENLFLFDGDPLFLTKNSKKQKPIEKSIDWRGFVENRRNKNGENKQLHRINTNWVWAEEESSIFCQSMFVQKSMFLRHADLCIQLTETIFFFNEILDTESLWKNPANDEAKWRKTKNKGLLKTA